MNKMPRGLKICPESIRGSRNEIQKQWHQVPIGFTNQYTNLITDQAIDLVNITILVWADRFLLIFLSPKTELKSKFLKAFTISTTNKANKLSCKIWAEPNNKFAVKMK